jgi:addiction module RelE/StbE family toxin
VSTILYSPAAKEDLREIAAYIGVDLSSPPIATSIVSRITQSIRNLETFPCFGTPLSAIISMETNYRFLASGNYVVFYRYEKTEDTCYIIRILHGRRDTLALLLGEDFGTDE